MMTNRPHVMQLVSSLEVGGSEKLLLSFLSACRQSNRMDYVVVIMNQDINPTMWRELQALGYPVYCLKRPRGHLHPKYLLQLLRIIKTHQVELIHSHNRGSKLWAVLCKLFTKNLKLVFTIHDTISVPRWSARQLWLHRHWIDMNIAISKAVSGQCEAIGLKNYRQVYNGINLDKFKNENRSALCKRVDQHSFEERPLRILQVGRMELRLKGQDILVKAIQLCKENGLNVHATLMGGVYHYNQADFSYLRSLVTNLGLEREISFRINRTDVQEQLAGADLFIMPSRFEGLGLSILEAMAAGVPVISSNSDALCELVQEGLTGHLFEKEKPEGLYGKIRLLYENPKMADFAREKALCFVQNFNIDGMVMQYDALYESMMMHSGLSAWNTEERRLTDGLPV